MSPLPFRRRGSDGTQTLFRMIHAIIGGLISAAVVGSGFYWLSVRDLKRHSKALIDEARELRAETKVVKATVQVLAQIAAKDPTVNVTRNTQGDIVALNYPVTFSATAPAPTLETTVSVEPPEPVRPEADKSKNEV
jgi:outer membrane biosynthesis protein TonB